MVSALPSPMQDTSSAAVAALNPNASPYSGRMEAIPLSKKPPIKPANMMMGCASSACQTPPKPTRALCASSARGSGGISRLQARPVSKKPITHHSACGLSVPSQAKTAGPMTKVKPTRVSKMPT